MFTAVAAKRRLLPLRLLMIALHTGVCCNLATLRCISATDSLGDLQTYDNAGVSRIRSAVEADPFA
jgi:hypothetical protein